MHTSIDISEGALTVLSCTEADVKADTAARVANAWQKDDLEFAFSKSPNLRPERPEKPELRLPADMPRRRKGGNDANRIALLHAVAHIELNAIDLAFDIVARFGGMMPRAFTDDWVKVGQDEAKHFKLLNTRLRELGSEYGALPAHDGLWQSAETTRHDLAARLAVVPMVLEARGLDVTPGMIERFERLGDHESARILSIIYEEEISHVSAGKRWFSHIARERGKSEKSYFHQLVTDYFYGQLKRPFNRGARDQAGIPCEFYEPLADMIEAI